MKLPERVEQFIQGRRSVLERGDVEVIVRETAREIAEYAVEAYELNLGPYAVFGFCDLHFGPFDQREDAAQSEQGRDYPSADAHADSHPSIDPALVSLNLTLKSLRQRLAAAAQVPAQGQSPAQSQVQHPEPAPAADHE